MQRRRTPAPYLAFATVIVAVLIAGAFAAGLRVPANSVGAKQLKANAVTSAKVKNGSLLARDFRAGELPMGAQGQPGETGATGATGAPGSSGTATAPSTTTALPGYMTSGGTIKLAKGQSKLIWSYGPFKVNLVCSALGDATSVTLRYTSTQAGSALSGEQGTTADNQFEGATYDEEDNTTLNLAAPDGTTLDGVVDLGINGLGSDCWMHGFAIGQGANPT